MHKPEDKVFNNVLKYSSHHFEVLKVQNDLLGVEIQFEPFLQEGVKATSSGKIRAGMNLISQLNEEEIAFVISHEFHHLLKNDPNRIHGVLISLERGDYFAQQELPTRAFSSLYNQFKDNEIFKMFVLEIEIEADQFAKEYLKQNGWDACKAISAIQAKSGVDLDKRIREVCKK